MIIESKMACIAIYFDNKKEGGLPMNWLLPVILRIVLISGIYPILLKGRIVQENLAKRFFLQYFMCAILAGIFALATGQFVFSGAFWIMYGVGIFIGIGTYLNWLTTKMNLSATSLFLFFDDLLAITLGFIFLDEIGFLSPALSMGLLICLIGIVIYSYENYRKKRRQKEGAGKKEYLPLKFFVYVGIFSTAWGIASFSKRYFALEGLEIGTYLFGWYFGTFTAAMIVCLKKLGIRQLALELRTTTEKREVGLMAVSSVIIMLNIILSFWALRLAPLTVVQPIFYISALVLPLLIGLYVFKEKKSLTQLDILSYSLGVMGTIVIGVAFSLSW